MTPKVAESPKTQHVSTESREHSSRLSALSNFSIGDMFRDVRDGSKSVKFPEKLLKVLEQIFVRVVFDGYYKVDIVLGFEVV